LSSRFVEPRESIDYVYVIHAQLDRVAKARTQLYKNGLSVNPFETGVTNYLFALESLHAILLPELRGNSKKYINLAWKLLYLDMAIEGTRGKERNSITIPPYKSQSDKLTKLKEERERIIPKDVKEQLYEMCYYMAYRAAALVADKALEEMLRKLNEAGLLIRGKAIKVGIPHGASELDKKGNEV